MAAFEWANSAEEMIERKIKLVGILVYFSLNVSSGWMFTEDKAWISILLLLVTLFSLIIQWEMSHRLHRLARKLYPKLSMLKQRVIAQFIWICALTFLIQLLTDLLIDQLILNTPFSIDLYRLIGLALQASAFSITSIGLFEAYYNYSSLRTSEMEKEELMRLNLKSKLDSLKSQVNPHFLFNSLNTLSSLIQKDAEKAEEFVEELSNVYRFLLRTNEQELISLRDELAFISSYMHLLITRYGNNLHFSLRVDEYHLDYLLPSLTLQLLVENAVKHNIISSERPLSIRVYTEGEQLCVANTLQKKKREVLSDKTGLANIISKYRLLKQAEVIVRETEQEFVVTLPLLEPKIYAGIDR